MAISDPTPEQIASLSPKAQAYAIEIITYLRKLGIPAIIVANGGRRSQSVQEGLVRLGVSATRNSSHLTGDAWDLDIYGLSRDQIPEIFWTYYGQLVESYGLVWGGRWSHPYDPGHCELPRSMRSA